MSARAKTTDRAICEAVRRVLESGGEEGLSMQAVAEAVGIRTPSLYKHFANRADLLSAAARDALRELGEAMNDPMAAGETYECLERMAHVYRKFAKKNPRTYTLIFSEAMAAREDLLAARQGAAEPLLALLSRQVGNSAALPAARLLVSYLHGFLSMEVTRAFRFGGNVNEAFQYGLTKIIESVVGKKNPA